MGKLSFLAGALALLRLIGHITDPVLTSSEIHRIVGEPDRTVVAPPAGELRIVTWNIERGVRFNEISSELQRLNADVVLLQEADIGCRRSDNRNVPRELAAVLGMNWVAAGEFQEIGESRNGVPALTTQAILSRFAITEASVIRFHHQSLLRWKLNPLQPRRGARIALKAQTAGVLIYNAHFESGGSESLRTRQMGEILDDHARSRHDAPVVIAGDFNNAPPSHSPLFVPLEERGFQNVLDRKNLARTSEGNDHPIDWIFVSGFSGDGTVANTGKASDHYPVVAELREAASRRDARERSLRMVTTQTP